MLLILNQHNELRNLIASGSHRLYKPAKKMAFMQWEKSLSYVSSFNLKTCEFQHDDCRNTFEFKYSGQNLGIREVQTRAKDRRILMNHFIELIKKWALEGDLYCNQTFIDYFKPHPNHSFMIGHFTEMVREENAFVGCSGSEYSKRNRWFYSIACNYATNNFYGETVYSSGPSCSACLTGCHKTYTSLCSEFEKYKLN